MAKLRVIRRSPRSFLAAARTLLVGAVTVVAASAPAQTITTVAGGGPDTGPATARPVGWPYHVALDSAGNRYVATGPMRRVVKIDAAGILSVVAGHGGNDSFGDGGPAILAGFRNPSGVAVDPAGNLYVADSVDHKVRRVDTGGTISSVAGTGVLGYNGDGISATTARLNGPKHLAFLPGSPAYLYIADQGNHRVRRVNMSTGLITTVAGTGTPGFNGDGLATSAQLNAPNGVAVDASGDVYIADTGNQRVRRISGTTITTIAGTGSAGFSDGFPATSRQLNNPEGVFVDAAGNVFIADEYNYRVRKVDSGGSISTVAGTGAFGFSGDSGPATSATMNRPWAVAVDPAGNLHIGDTFNSRLRVVDTGGTIDTVGGNGTIGYGGDSGPAVAATMWEQQHVALDPAGNKLYIADARQHRIRQVNLATGVITTVAGTGQYFPFNDNVPAITANLSQPQGVAVDTAGNIYIAETGNHRIRKVDTGGIITTLAGTGTAGYDGEGSPATSRQLNWPFAVAVDSAGNVYVADNSNHRVRKVTPGGTISTVAGTGTGGYNGDGFPATSFQVNGPSGLAVDAAGNVFIAEFARIRKLTPGGTISTVGGSGTAGFSGDGAAATAARLNVPRGVAVDGAGNILIADTGNNRVRLIEARTGLITTVAGGAVAGFAGDGGPATAAKLNQAYSVAVNSLGQVFVSDQLNSRIRAMTVGTDLEITKTDFQATQVPGTAVSYQVRVINNGPNTVTSVNVIDTPPGTLTITSYDTGGVGTYVSGTGDWTGLSLAPSQFVDLTVNGFISSAATSPPALTNTATVAPPLGLTDPTPGNDQYQDSDSLTPQADLTISIMDFPDPVPVGFPLQYDLLASNNGPSDATNVVVTDPLPPGVLFQSATAPCAQSLGVVTCNLGTLTAGSSYPTLSIVVVPTAPGRISNTASISSGDVPDPGPLPNNFTAITSVPLRATGGLGLARAGHTATLLQNGKVLVVGGEIGPGSLTPTCELYDPLTGTWSFAGPLAAPRAWHTATLLGNGKVLVAGGNGGGAGTLNNADLYDPETDTWSNTGSLGVDRQFHTATLVGDGRVLVTGGFSTLSGMLSIAEIYDPGTGSWSVTGPMVAARQEHTATFLPGNKVLLAGGLGSNSSETYDVVSDSFTPTAGAMGRDRDHHSATLLPNGKVLVAGGSGGVSDAETYDPGTGLWTSTGSMSGPRGSHTATLLPGGKVLVAGGYDAGTSANSELYDPGSGTWSAGPPLLVRRGAHTATILPDGRVLLAGGFDNASTSYVGSAELHETAGTFVPTGNLGIPRSSHTTTLLPNGTVLAAGDGFSSAPTEIYDAATGLWTPTASGLVTGRYDHTATLLVNGKVLVAGGKGGGVTLAKAELFNPATSSWVATGDMNASRRFHTATLLPDGTVFVPGGVTGINTCVSSYELYKPVTGTWLLRGALPTCRSQHAAVLLGNGKVLLIGGTEDGFAALATTILYDPVADTWTPQGNLARPRQFPSATLLPNGRVLVTGGTNDALTEIYDPTSGNWSAAGNFNQSRANTAATLLPGGRVLVAGGTFGGTPIKSAEIFDPATLTWTLTADLLTRRANHTALFLPNGKVLIAGGWDGAADLASSELYDLGLGFLDTWRPALMSVTPDAIINSDALLATGNLFRGISEASGGQGTQGSSTAYPLVELRRLDNDAVRWLPLDPVLGWNTVSFRSLPLSGLVPGPAMVTVFTNGIPSMSRTVMVECPAATFNSTPGDQSVCTGSAVQFTVSVNGPSPEFQWRKNGVPLSDGGRLTGSRTDTLQITNVDASDNGDYDVVVSLSCSSVMAISTPPANLTVSDPLSSVSAGPPGPWNVCQSTGCTAGPLFEAHVGGGNVAHQWGFRTSTGGPITDIPGATTPSYTIQGTDFPGPGTYYVVVRTQPSCGTRLTSNEIVVIVDAAGATDTVRYLTVTSKDSQNILEWRNPPAFGNVRIRYTTDPTSCMFPSAPDGSDGSLGPFDVPGTANEPSRFVHTPITNGDRYCYTVWVATGAPYSAGKSIQGRPFAVPPGPGAKWGYNMGIFSMVPPGNGQGVVFAVANDGSLHSLVKGAGADGGTWPGPLAGFPLTWKPQSMNGPSQGRPSGIPVPTAGSTRTIFLSSQDGHVYAFNAETGAPAWSPSSPPLAPAPHLQAAPSGVFIMFGGTRDLIFVGTRDPAGSKFYALRVVDGDKLAPGWEFDGGVYGKIGAISGQAAVDQVARRVYFASRAFDGANNKTVWCLDLETGSPCPGFVPQAHGDIDTGVSLSGGLLFVGTNDPKVKAVRTSDGGEDWFYPLPALEGAPKGYVAVDRLTGNSYFSTATTVWSLNPAGTQRWTCPSLGSPSTPVYAPGDLYLYVGAGDGKLYRLDAGSGAPVVAAPFPLPLGDGSAGVGSPTFDLSAGFAYVGTEDGTIYAVKLP